MHIKSVMFPALILVVLAASGCLQSYAEKDYPLILSSEEEFIGIVHDAGTTNNVKYDWWFAAGNYIGTTKSGDAFSNFGQALVKVKVYWNSSTPEGIYSVESHNNYNDEFNEKTAIMVVSDKIEVKSGTVSIVRILVTDKSKEEKADIYLGSSFVATVKMERTKFPRYQPIFEYNMDTSIFPGKGNYEVHVIGNKSRKEIGKRTIIVR